MDILIPLFETASDISLSFGVLVNLFAFCIIMESISVAIGSMASIMR